MAEVELTNHQPLPPLLLPMKLTARQDPVVVDEYILEIRSWRCLEGYSRTYGIACTRDRTYGVAYTEIGLIMLQRRRERWSYYYCYYYCYCYFKT